MKAFSRAAGLAAALLLTTSPLAAFAQTVAGAETPATVSLSAFGQVKSTPDEATISLGVQSKAATAAQAMGDNAEAMNRVIAALRARGLPSKAIQTSNISLSAQYDYEQNQPARLSGYLASNEVAITVDDIGKLGSMLDAVVGAGANQISGISFGLKDTGAAEDSARLAAVKALRAKADLYAGATGYHVGRLLALNEGGPVTEPLRPVVMMRAMAAAPSPTPVAPGELTTRVDISAVYELAK